MTRHLRRLRELIGLFLLGLITDIGVCLYYRSVSSGMVFMAMWLSFLVTLIPFFVMWKGIEARRPVLFVAYALGAAMGTLIGMMIRL